MAALRPPTSTMVTNGGCRTSSTNLLARKPVPKHLRPRAHAADVPRPILRKATPPPSSPELLALDSPVDGINTTEFAPGMADESRAKRAADQVTAYADALKQDRSRRSRLWWALHPGPLRWRRDGGH